MSLLKKIWDVILKYKVELFFVFLIFILAVILRVITLNNLGDTWTDEQTSWFLANQPSLYKVIEETFTSDLHTPLYFLILHLWIKVFGDETNTMRWLGFVLTMPLIPMGYYAGRRLFNKTTGYITAIILAVNTYCIYYCLEIRMYSLNLTLSLFSAYFFARYMNDFKKRDAIGYILSISLLIYNFAVAPLLAFCYLIFGFIYLYFKNRENIKKFLIVQGIAFVVSLPAIIMIILLAYKIYAVNLVSIVKHMYNLDDFSKYLPITILENFFSFENYQMVNNTIFNYQDISEKKNVVYFISVFIPILFSLFIFIKSLFNKSKNFYFAILPSLAFFIILYILAIFKIGAIQARYLTVVYPVIVIALAYGYSTFKYKELSYIFFSLYLFLISCNLIFNPGKNIYNIHLYHTSSYYATILKSQVELKPDDILLYPFDGYGVNYHIRHDNLVPFYSSRILYSAHKKHLKMYFGDDYKKYNKSNIREILGKEYINNIPHKAFEEYLYNNYIKNMKKGQRFVYSDTPFGLKNNFETLNMPSITEDNYLDYNMEMFLYRKIHLDCYLILKKYLKEIEQIEDIYIFEKE